MSYFSKLKETVWRVGENTHLFASLPRFQYQFQVYIYNYIYIYIYI